MSISVHDKGGNPGSLIRGDPRRSRTLEWLLRSARLRPGDVGAWPELAANSGL